MSSPTYKICLIGDGAVGKTALRNNFMTRTFSPDYYMTIGAEIAYKSINVSGKSVSLQIWDIAGQSFFYTVREKYYTGATGALAVFDVTRPESLENLKSWVEEIWNKNGKGKIPIVVLGNKIDLRESISISITPEECQTVVSDLEWAVHGEGFKIPYLETSALAGYNVYNAFKELSYNINAYIEKKLQEL